jgi:quinol monooxygenase YgiN
MYVRFVKLRVKPGMEAAYDRFYRAEVAPAVLENEGCLFAHLIQDEDSPTAFVSLSFWRSQEDAAGYEQSGRFAALVERNRPFLDDSSEWRMVLKEDLTLSYQPVMAEPEVEAFDVTAASTNRAPDERGLAHMYFRIVAGHADPDRIAELRQVFREEVIDALREVDGCRYAYLAAGRAENEVISVTLWDSRAQALAYESSELYLELMAKLRPMMSSLTQWKATLDPERQSNVTTSEDLKIRGFRVPGADTGEA